MKHTSGHQRGARDPRSMVTPDAFVVSDALLGMPLAPPSRRFSAILIDLLVIGLLTVLTKSFSLVLGIVIAVLLVRAGFRRISVPGSAFSRAMRASVGCLGVFIGFVTVLLWIAFGIDMAVTNGEAGPRGPGSAELPRVELDMAGAMTGATAGMEFANAPDLEAAEAAGTRLVALGLELGLEPGEIREILVDLVPSDRAWSQDADALVARLGAMAETGSVDGRDAVASVNAAAGQDTSDSTGADRDTAYLMGTPVIRDTLASLEQQVEALVEEVRRAREEVAEAESSRSGGLLAWLRSVVDDLGFGFGWATLYMTVTLSWWKGQTVGKRLLGIRVVRLDGDPITWWTAFERAGGYAAGFATGLLGFAQIFWDANRQAIHDRIVGTVVIREGPPKTRDREFVL